MDSSVGAGKVYPVASRMAAPDAPVMLPNVAEGDVARGRARGFLDCHFALVRAAPARVHEARLRLHSVDEVVLRRDRNGAGREPRLGRLVEALLILGELRRYVPELRAREYFFPQGPRPPRKSDDARLEIARADLDPERNTPEFPVVELGARRETVSVVHRDTEPTAPERRGDLGDRAVEAGRVLIPADRDDDHLVGSHRRREHQSLGVTVRHNERADEPGADAPTRHLDKTGGARLVEILHPRHLREVLSEVMDRPHLEPLAVRHETFDARRFHSSSELLARGLLAHHSGDGQDLGGEVVVQLNDIIHLGARFSFGGVGSVTLLPLELRVPQEETRTLLPADDVRPLVEAQRQVPVGTDPSRHTLMDDRLGSRTDDERLLERFAAGVGDHGAFGREPGDVILLPGEKRLWD